LKQIEDED
jgi:hypothetical protein